jgi:hypothetical protein
MADKKKEGLTVKEIGELGNKYRFEVFICLLLLLTCIFNFIFVGGYLSILSATAGTLIGVLLSTKIERFLKSILTFPLNQQLATQIVIAGAVLVIGIFLPFIIFLFIGLYGGLAIYKTALQKH